MPPSYDCDHVSVPHLPAGAADMSAAAPLARCYQLRLIAVELALHLSDSFSMSFQEALQSLAALTARLHDQTAPLASLAAGRAFFVTCRAADDSGEQVTPQLRRELELWVHTRSAMRHMLPDHCASPPCLDPALCCPACMMQVRGAHRHRA
jgi:hypothetical protein